MELLTGRRVGRPPVKKPHSGPSVKTGDFGLNRNAPGEIRPAVNESRRSALIGLFHVKKSLNATPLCMCFRPLAAVRLVAAWGIMLD